MFALIDVTALDTASGMVERFGPLGLVLCILGIVIKMLFDSNADHRTEMDRINKAHDAELEELRADIAELRARLDERDALVEQERSRRYDAEIELHRLRITLGVGGLANGSHAQEDA